jgi:transcriptional regulator with XRE-family HTH domain
VRNILYGRSVNPNSDTLNAIAKAFGCTVDELIQGHSENKGEETTNPQAALRQSTYNWDLAHDCVQMIEAIIRDSQKKPSAEIFWSLVEETYYYSVHANTTAADKKYAEWLVFKKIP